MNHEEADLRVEMRNGPDGELEPARLWFGRRGVAVLAVLDRWHAADHSYFKVDGADGARYIVRRDLASGLWDLAVYDSEPEDRGAPS